MHPLILIAAVGGLAYAAKKMLSRDGRETSEPAASDITPFPQSGEVPVKPDAAWESGRDSHHPS